MTWIEGGLVVGLTIVAWALAWVFEFGYRRGRKEAEDDDISRRKR